jgi:hypothetical protein
MILDPTMLENISGTIGVLAATVVVTAILATIRRWRARSPAATTSHDVTAGGQRNTRPPTTAPPKRASAAGQPRSARRQRRPAR